MNSWDSSDDSSKASTLQGLEYSVGLIFAAFILAVIAVYLYMRWTITLASIDGPTGPDSVIVIIHQSNAPDDNATSSSSSYQKFAYSEIGAHKINESQATSCSICLVDYEESDLIRLLPICGHIFHLKCIDPWLVLHPTCPVCRSSPSISTPLAQALL